MSKKIRQSPEFIQCPFTIIVDSNEGSPWYFKSMVDENQTPIVIETIRKALWPKGLADYSIEGHENHVQIERKSLEDLFATLGGRRDAFEEEVFRLNHVCDSAAVIVEGNLAAIKRWRGHGPHPNSVVGTIRNWQHRYPKVHWKLCVSRSEAEVKAFEFLKLYWDAQKRGKLPRQRKDLSLLTKFGFK